MQEVGTTEYSAEFVRAVTSHLASAGVPEEESHGHLGDERSRLYQTRAFTIPELEYQVGSLDGKRVLDFGCGTGSSAVALAEAGAVVSCFDVNAADAEICRLRLREHGFSDCPVQTGASIVDTDLAHGQFDLVLMNAVIEHVPKSIQGLRKTVICEAFDMLAPGGCLAICQSQNRMWPRDIYISGRWLLPWSRPGSRRVYRSMVESGHQRAFENEGDGALDLEKRGLWGTTYFELRSYLPESAECLNLRPGFDRRTAFTHTHSRGRRTKETLVYWTVRRTIGWPVAACAPIFWPLIFRKPVDQ